MSLGKSKKTQFYVEFLGWMECRGLRGRQYTEPIIQELRRRRRKTDKPPKLTLQLTADQLLISQALEEKKKKGIKKISFPPIAAHDVTYAVQATRPSDNKLDDVVACIYLGYIPRTQRYVHVHVYRFDEPSTANKFVKHLNRFIEENQARIEWFEKDLVEKGELDDPRLTFSDGMSDYTAADSEDGSPTFGSDEIEADLQSLSEVTPIDSLTEELKMRLKDIRPLLHPPKDYDTISRARGNLKDINERRSHLTTMGPSEEEVGSRSRHASQESGIDLPSHSTDNSGEYPTHPHHHLNAVDATPSILSPVVGESDLVYPPRQPSRSARPLSPAMPNARQPSAHSSRSSHHSDGNNSDIYPIYHRSNSNPAFASPLRPTLVLEDERAPPVDYEDELVMMRPKPFSAAALTNRPASGPVTLGNAVGRNSPRNSARGLLEKKDHYINELKRSDHPHYGSHDELNFRRPDLAVRNDIVNFRPSSPGYEGQGMVTRVQSVRR